MMKANEFRIGNLTLLNGTINEVSQMDFEQWTFDNMQPIPLTPEILEKCGISEYLVSFNPTDELADEPNYYTEISLTVNVQKIYIKKKSSSHPIYLHQLQNLYFALTGEELVINL